MRVNAMTMAMCLVCALWPALATAITAADLRATLDGDEPKPVVVDMRRPVTFDAGHIPGSVNIPGAKVVAGGVPPFGNVVLVWDGLDRSGADRVLEALRGHPGIASAELLDGGYPAWSETSSITGDTVQSGEPRTITYQQFVAIDDPALIVIDIRAQRDGTPLTAIGELVPAGSLVRPLDRDRVDMRAVLEARSDRGVRVRAVPGWLKTRSFNPESLYVLIDDGDGRLSEVIARRLGGMGAQRVFMLAGGELSLRARGVVEQVTRTSGDVRDGE